MSTIRDCGPAFPVLKTSPLGMYVDQNGMSLRDYFAAKAMQTLCANEAWEDGGVSRAAYALADAMLAAREGQP